MAVCNHIHCEGFSECQYHPQSASVQPHKLQPLMLDLQTIRKLAYKSKAIAAGLVGPSAQQELMMIERTADVLVARVLDEMGASCDRSKFGGSNEVSQ